MQEVHNDVSLALHVAKSRDKINMVDKWEYSFEKCRDDASTARYIKVYKALHAKKWKDLPRTPMMTYLNTTMVYTEVILKKRVDSSTPTARNKRSILKTKDILFFIPSLHHLHNFEDKARKFFRVLDPILHANDNVYALLDAEAGAPTNCNPPPLTSFASENRICMGEEFIQMQELLDNSFNEDEELWK